MNGEIQTTDPVLKRINSFITTNKVPRVELKSMGFIDPSVAALIPEDTARRFGALAFGQKDGKLSVAMWNPFDPIALETIRIRTGFSLDVVFSPRAVIEEEIDKIYAQKGNLEESMK
ncbi:MAG: hypothetical protein WC703_09705, partial [Candidatus Neomarinimicrobiota bacterium]